MFKLEPYDSYEVEDDFQLELPIDKFSLNPQAPTFIPKDRPRFKHFRTRFYNGYLSYDPNFDDGYGMYYPYRDAYHHPRDVYYNWYGGGYYEQPNHKQNKRTRKQRKYSYRSKQNKINVVLNNLKRKFSNNGKLAHGEVLRGEDTLRIDVKRFTALQQIEKVIDDIERNPNVNIIKVDFPVSQKNRFQKKGFIAYLKCGSPEQAILLHDELRVLIDPKWQNKNLFRINIALDQQRDYVEEIEDDLAENTETASQDSESTTESTNSSVESGEKDIIDNQNLEEGVLHGADFAKDEEHLVKKFHQLNLAPERTTEEGHCGVKPTLATREQ